MIIFVKQKFMSCRVEAQELSQHNCGFVLIDHFAHIFRGTTNLSDLPLLIQSTPRDDWRRATWLHQFQWSVCYEKLPVA